MLENAILEHAKAINNLADALRGIGQVPLALPAKEPVVVSTVTVGGGGSGKTEKEPTGPFYWKDADTNYFGKESTKKALDKMLKEKASIVQIEEAEYSKLESELRERNAAAAAKEKESKTIFSESAKLPEATVEEVIAAFTKYLPKDLDADERKARHAFVKPLLQRFGADKATNLKPEHRALAIQLVERKMAGEDIDPEGTEFLEESVI